MYVSAMQYTFEITAPDISTHQTFTATIKVPLEKPEDAPGVLSYMRSIQLKTDIMNGWARKNAPDYGISVKGGGPRPVFTDPARRDSKVLAYEVDFQFTKRI